MAFLPSDEDASAFQAALDFVDEFARECHCPHADAPSLKEKPPNTELWGGPSFSLTCTMAPFHLTNLCGASSGLQLLLPSSEEIEKQSKSRKQPTNTNRARDEVQYELTFLQGKVAELEQVRHSNMALTRDLSMPAVSTQLVQVPGVWKEISARQRRKRDEFQRENARLRRVVERKKKLAAGLSSLLRKQLTQEGVLCLAEEKHRITDRRAMCVLDFRGDIREFHDLFHHLRAAYNEIDAVLAASGLSKTEVPTDDVHIREDVGGKYIEVFANKVLPFSLRETGEVAWDHFKGVEKHFGSGGLYEKAAKCSLMKNLDQPYTIIEDFTMELFSKNSRADVKSKQIVQRLVEPDRDMILFVSSAIPVEIKHKPIDGLIYHAREYALTKRFNDSTPEHELSLLQYYVQVSFDYDPGVEFDIRHVRSAGQFISGYFADTIRRYQERIENALIDRALRQQ